jgi:hypothetical protein
MHLSVTYTYFACLFISYSRLCLLYPCVIFCNVFPNILIYGLQLEGQNKIHKKDKILILRAYYTIIISP